MSRTTNVYESNEELQKLFEKYNKEYFQGKIKDVDVKWSNRLRSCAGICYYNGKKDTYINLSSPILTLRPRKDLITILLHEMIHAYLYVVDGFKEREEHGPKFMQIMDKINTQGKHNITVFHEFHDEVESLQSHWWKCTGKCVDVPPKYGIVKRALDRPPGPTESWWLDHRKLCKGSFVKIKESKENKDPKKRRPSAGDPICTSASSKPHTKRKTMSVSDAIITSKPKKRKSSVNDSIDSTGTKKKRRISCAY